MEWMRSRRHLAVVAGAPSPGTDEPRPVACTCGFVGGSSSTDAIVPAVMALVAEYRQLLGVADDGREEQLRARPGRESWSMLERVVAVADSFHTRARALRALADGQRDRAHLLQIRAPRAGANDWPLPVVLASLQSATAELAEAASRIPTREWDEPHAVAERAVTVRSMLDDALHEGRHTLADVAAVVGTAVPQSA